jgi:hypothetical protein
MMNYSKTTIMNAQQFAAMLGSREYRNELNRTEFHLAKENRLVVVYGASDDLVEFAGVWNDEIGSGDGDIIYLDKNGPIEDDGCDCPFAEKARKLIHDSARRIKVNWNTDPKFTWTFETDIPHAIFDVYEDDEGFCRALVFSLDDM